MVWVLLFLIYTAPPTAVDWDGPWTSNTHAISAFDEKVFDTKGECDYAAVLGMGKVHQGMLAPIRYRCVPFPKTLPIGAPR